jgi:dTDP-4-amino-4,6-dideoxygalactose transaminase
MHDGELLQHGIRATAAEHEGVLPVFRPYLGPEVQRAAADALEAGWLGMGGETALFEDELAAYLGLESRPLVAMSSCTAALHAAFVLAGVGAGDEVVCPPFTYVAGHQAVSATGADVVFCDIEDETLGVDPESLRRVLSERTRAVLVLHYAGVPAAGLDEIYEIAAEHGLRVVEDAAHAFGSTHDGRPIGTFGDLTCFSFGPVKVITSLEGGAIVTGNEDDVRMLHEFRLVGVTKDTAVRYENRRTWDYDVVRQGFRYHLGSIPAAIGRSQLALADVFIRNRQAYCRTFNERLAGIDGLITPGTDFAGVSPFIYFVRTPDEATRSDLIRHLSERGIASGIHFLGAHEFTYYQDCRRDELPVTERVAGQILTLPLHSFMSEQTIDQVADGVRSFFV